MSVLKERFESLKKETEAARNEKQEIESGYVKDYSQIFEEYYSELEEISKEYLEILKTEKPESKIDSCLIFAYAFKTKAKAPYEFRDQSLSLYITFTGKVEVQIDIEDKKLSKEEFIKIASIKYGQALKSGKFEAEILKGEALAKFFLDDLEYSLLDDEDED